MLGTIATSMLQAQDLPSWFLSRKGCFFREPSTRWFMPTFGVHRVEIPSSRIESISAETAPCGRQVKGDFNTGLACFPSLLPQHLGCSLDCLYVGQASDAYSTSIHIARLKTS